VRPFRESRLSFVVLSRHASSSSQFAQQGMSETTQLTRLLRNIVNISGATKDDDPGANLNCPDQDVIDEIV